MKNWRLNTYNQSAFEKTGPIPRSITKTFEKFKKELEPNSESEIIEEFRVSRYQTAASIKYLVIINSSSFDCKSNIEKVYISLLLLTISGMTTESIFFKCISRRKSF